MEILEKLLSSIVDELSAEIMGLVQALPGFPENQSPELISKILSATMSRVLEDDGKVWEEDLGQAFTLLIFGNEPLIDHETSHLFTKGYYISSALLLFEKAKAKLTSQKTDEAFAALWSLQYTLGIIFGNELGRKEALMDHNKKISHPARIKKAELDKQHRERVLESYNKMKDRNPAISKNRAAQLIALNVNLAEKTVRNYLINN